MSAVSMGITHNNAETQVVEAAGVEFAYRRFGRPAQLPLVMLRALGLVVRDVVLTADEIRGLTSGLLASRQPALGHISFIEWLNENGPTLGRAYASELDRHFRMRKASARA